MSSNVGKYKGNIVQALLFLGILAVATYFFQTFVIKPAFKSAMLGLFAPPAAKTQANSDLIKEGDFILDMTSVPKNLDKNGEGYEKGSG